MATITRKVSAHASYGEPLDDNGAHIGKVNLLSSTFVNVNELRERQCGILVEQPGQQLSEEDFNQLSAFAKTLRVRELHTSWYRKHGRAVERQLVEAAKALTRSNARYTTLASKCNQSRFQDVLRQAFKEEEEEEEPLLLQLCKAVVGKCSDIPSADAYIAVHRIIADANASAHRPLGQGALQALLSAGKDSAEEVSASTGQPVAAPMLRKMAADLLQ